jgi:arsenite-transporting ATPase
VRILFFAGKGGVGKTSIAAATGMKGAEMDKRTVILSLDAAHSLSDIFDLDRALLDQNQGRPLRVGKKLWIQEMDIQKEVERHWKDIHDYLSLLFNTTGLDDVLAEELAILPGMEEISLLLYINRYVREKTYDVIILDCAPTGESLRFISLPTALEWYMHRVFRMERAIAKVVRPVAKRMYDLPLPGDEYFAAVEYLYERLRGVDAVLTDPKITSVRLVTNPEKVVLRETQRAFMYFCLHKMNIDAVVMNRILPDLVHDNYFTDWRKSQKQNLERAQEYFQPIPILPAPLFQDEVLGRARLRKLADQVYGGRNPLDRFFSGEPYTFHKENGEYRLRLTLPFLLKGDVELNKVFDELVVRVGAVKRHILLPKKVAASQSIQAKMEGNQLVVLFGGGSNGQEKS